MHAFDGMFEECFYGQTQLNSLVVASVLSIKLFSKPKR